MKKKHSRYRGVYAMRLSLNFHSYSFLEIPPPLFLRPRFGLSRAVPAQFPSPSPMHFARSTLALRASAPLCPSPFLILLLWSIFFFHVFHKKAKAKKKPMYFLSPFSSHFPAFFLSCFLFACFFFTFTFLRCCAFSLSFPFLLYSLPYFLFSFAYLLKTCNKSKNTIKIFDVSEQQCPFLLNYCHFTNSFSLIQPFCFPDQNHVSLFPNYFPKITFTFKIISKWQSHM